MSLAVLLPPSQNKRNLATDEAEQYQACGANRGHIPYLCLWSLKAEYLVLLAFLHERSIPN